MSEPTSHKTLPAGAQPEVKVKVIGVGGAGNNALDRLILEGGLHVDLVACNTDVQSLASSVASHKIQLGRSITRGLGAGGDPEVGYTAAEEAVDDLRAALEGAPLVLVCAGLGGGTGSGAAPLIVKLAREGGALVLVCATLPFSFEGKRRGRQAQEALAAIQQYADAVVCFENDRMGELISAESGIQDAFAGADQIISQCVRSIIELVNRRGLIRLGFDDLLTALRNHDSRCLFGYGEGSGEHRGIDALAHALKNPLMDGGTLLGSAANVLVNIVGGNDLTLSEVQTLMEALSGHIDEKTQLLFGASVDPKMDGRIGVTLISSLNARSASGAAPRPVPQTQPQPQFATQPTAEMPAFSAHPAARSDAPTQPPARYTPPVPVVGSPVTPSGRSAVAGAGSSVVPRTATSQPQPPAAEVSQGGDPQQQPALRGRFEKSQPTISEDGEDLDVPTFLRKNFRAR